MKTAKKKTKKVPKTTKKSKPRAKAKPRDESWDLILYVAGTTSKSLSAIRNLRAICQEHLSAKYNVVIVDLSKDPHLAREHQIFAIPTLVKKLPTPVRKIIGDLSNTEKVLVGLDVKSAHS